MHDQIFGEEPFIKGGLGFLKSVFFFFDLLLALLHLTIFVCDVSEIVVEMFGELLAIPLAQG